MTQQFPRPDLRAASARRDTSTPALADALADGLFRHRSSLVLVLVIPLAVAVFTEPAVDRPQLITGLILVGLGVALRLAAARVIGRGARVHRADLRGELATAGPYRWSRNPLYVAAGLMVSGLGFHAGCGWPSLMLLVATIVIYTPIVRHEEVALVIAGGESYLRYRARVWRWIGPPARDDDSGERAPWPDVLRRERFLIPGMILAIAGLTLVRTAQIPLGELLEEAAAGRVSAEVVAPSLVILGMIGNSLTIMWKRRKRAARGG